MNREELIKNYQGLKPVMHTEDYFRQCGRTSRMIADAIQTAKQGHAVVIVTKDVHMERWVREKLGRVTGISVTHYNPRKPELLDWDNLQAMGEYANHKTFIDHDVIYFNNLHLFRAASQYDPKIEVKGDSMTFVKDQIDASV